MTNRPLQAADLETILGRALLHKLLGETPFSSDDKSGARLELILRIVGNLRGSFNDKGVRRWFYRDRQRLHGESFLTCFPEGWEATDPGPCFTLGASISVANDW